MLDSALFSQYTRPMTPRKTDMTPTGRLNAPVGGILFDIYGTLLISGSGDIGLSKRNHRHLDRLTALLHQHGIDRSPDVLLNQFHAAVQRDHARKKAAGRDVPEIVVEDIWQAVLGTDDREDARRFALEFELIANPVYPMPDVGRLLDTCRRKRLPMGIISNAQFYTPLLFEFFLGADLTRLGFDPRLTLFSYRFGVAKPSPLLFTTAAERLDSMGCPAGHVLYVGNDMLNDVYPAHNCGFATALFAGDRRSLRLRRDDPRCRDLKPDLVVTELNQLTDLLGGS